MEIRELISEGKGKRIYATDDPNLAVLYFKDEATAFHGLKRGRILGKGEINNAICRHLFTLLKDAGIENHFISTLDARQSLVKRVQIIPIALKVRNIVAGSLAQRIRFPEGTRLSSPVVEVVLKDGEIDESLINNSHVVAMGLATVDEMNYMKGIARKVNDILSDYLKEINIELIDFKLEFGRYGDQILLADEISPDSCRFWDSQTMEPLDIDRFRYNLGNVEQAYQDVLHRMMGPEEN